MFDTVSGLIKEVNEELLGGTTSLLAGASDSFERAIFDMLEVLKSGRSQQGASTKICLLALPNSLKARCYAKQPTHEK